MPWDFYDKYESTDKRLQTIIASYKNKSNKTVDKSTGMSGAIPLKYTNIQDDGPGYPIDQVVFRYAEVLLSMAEVVNEQRGPTEAYQYVNHVRERAGFGSNSWSGFTKEQLRDSLLDERGRELYGEGVRRQDLIRHGKFISYAQARGTHAQPYHVLFPIPESVIIQGDGIIEQNTGYE